MNEPKQIPCLTCSFANEHVTFNHNCNPESEPLGSLIDPCGETKYYCGIMRPSRSYETLDEMYADCPLSPFIEDLQIGEKHLIDFIKAFKGGEDK